MTGFEFDLNGECFHFQVNWDVVWWVELVIVYEAYPF